MIKAIVAVGNNWEIGKINKDINKGELLFRLPADLEFFKSTTTGKIVVMGYNTLLSLPGSKPLKNRINIVICPPGIEPDGCIVFHEFMPMLQEIKKLAETQDVFIIGGGQLYSSMNYYCDEIIVTKVNAIDKEATVFYPNLDQSKIFKKYSESAQFEDNGYTCTHCIYKKINYSNSYIITDIDSYERALMHEL